MQEVFPAITLKERHSVNEDSQWQFINCQQESSLTEPL